MNGRMGGVSAPVPVSRRRKSSCSSRTRPYFERGTKFTFVVHTECCKIIGTEWAREQDVTCVRAVAADRVASQPVFVSPEFAPRTSNSPPSNLMVRETYLALLTSCLPSGASPAHAIPACLSHAITRREDAEPGTTIFDSTCFSTAIKTPSLHLTPIVVPALSTALHAYSA